MIPLVTGEQMRALDAATIGEYGLAGAVLMELAGKGLAEAAGALLDGGSRHVTVVCGKGNNGGDGFVAARWLARRGCVPEVFLAGEADELRGEARTNYDLYRKLGRAVEPLVDPAGMVLLAGSLRRAALCLDCLLGTGVTGAPREPVATVIRAILASGVPIVSADLPSGVDADTGAVYEPHLRAVRTVTFGAWKRGLAVHPGAGAAGEVVRVDIGLPKALIDGLGPLPGLLERSDIAAMIPPRPATAHKGDAGRVVIVGGSIGLGGAVALAGRAAMRGGAGLVTVAVPDCLADAMEMANLEVMSRPLRDTADGHVAAGVFGDLADLVRRADAVAVGPGLGRGEPAAELLAELLRSVECPLVVDADGLNLLATHPALVADRRGEWILTPHPGEASRLLEVGIDSIEHDRLGAAAALVERYRAVVLLKGARTVIAEPGGRIRINPTGTPAMASGGMGDALSGLLAALVGQGLAPFEAACAAAWLHGRAGELAAGGADAGLLAGDLIEALPRARAGIRCEQRSDQAR